MWTVFAMFLKGQYVSLPASRPYLLQGRMNILFKKRWISLPVSLIPHWPILGMWSCQFPPLSCSTSHRGLRSVNMRGLST